MQDQLKLIGMRTPLRRMLLLLPVALVLFGAWYAARWYVGNTMAEYAPNLEAGGLDIASSALRLAPDDPLTHFTLANLETKSLLPEQLTEAVRQYEDAVRLSPNDYRLWMSLGHAREQAGDAVGGEKALRRSIELAPAYSYPRWYLGNLLLREGRLDEAFTELRHASDADPNLRPQIFNLAWRVYDGDVGALKSAFGDSVEVRAQLASYLLERGRVDDALRLWSSFDAAEKRKQRATGASLIKTLMAAKRYRASLDVARDIAADGVATPAPEQFFNGSFESNAGEGEISVFDWQIKSVPQAQVGADSSVRHTGARSLRIVFNASNKLDFNNISQLVVVEPSTAYRLECFVRTQDLKSAETPRISVIDGVDASVLGASPPVPAGKNDWQPVTVNFKTPAKTDAVMIRISRAACGADAVCPIFGIVWYDDFNLQRAGADTGAGSSRK